MAAPQTCDFASTSGAIDVLRLPPKNDVQTCTIGAKDEQEFNWGTVLTSNEFISTLSGTLLGALLSLGVAAYLAGKTRQQALTDAAKARQLALDDSVQARRQITDDKQADELAKSKALLSSVLLKLVRMREDYRQTVKYLEGEFSRVSSLSDEVATVSIMPAANIPDSVHMTIEEASALLAFDQTSFREIFDLDQIHNGAMELLRVHGAERRDMQGMYTSSLVVDVKGEEVGLQLTPMLALRISALTALLSAIRIRLLEDHEQTCRAIDKFNLLLRQRLGLPYSFVDDADVRIYRNTLVATLMALRKQQQPPASEKPN